MHIRYFIGYVYHICLQDTIQSTLSLCLLCQAMLLPMPLRPLLLTTRSGFTVMHFFFPFSATIGDRHPLSAAIGAAACRDRSDPWAQFCAATDFNLRISCFGLLLHWEWYLLFSFFKEFHNDEFGCLHGFKVVHNENKSPSQDEPRNEPIHSVREARQATGEGLAR